MKLLQGLLARLDDARDIVAETADMYHSEDTAMHAGSDDDDLTEIQELKVTVAATIKSLFTMSILVRKPARHHLRIGSICSEVAPFEPWDYAHVKEKYPVANETLVTRLGSAITRRRMYVKYRERHTAKLKQGITNITNPIDLNEEKAASVLSDTIATSVQNQNIDFDDRASNSGATQTSYATTLTSGDAVMIPRRPKESCNGDPFECPICFHIIKIESTRAWNKHVFLDLQSYLCLRKDCATPHKLYGTRHEWLDHRNICRLNSNSSNTADLTCQLCNAVFSEDTQYGRHCARHLQDLALFALPPTMNCTDGDSDEDEPNIAAEPATDMSDEDDAPAPTPQEPKLFELEPQKPYTESTPGNAITADDSGIGNPNIQLALAENLIKCAIRSLSSLRRGIKTMSRTCLVIIGELLQGS